VPTSASVLKLAALTRQSRALDKMAFTMKPVISTPTVNKDLTPRPVPTVQPLMGSIKPGSMKGRQKGYASVQPQSAGPTQGLGVAARNTPPPAVT